MVRGRGFYLATGFVWNISGYSFGISSFLLQLSGTWKRRELQDFDDSHLNLYYSSSCTVSTTYHGWVFDLQNDFNGAADGKSEMPIKKWIAKILFQNLAQFTPLLFYLLYLEILCNIPQEFSRFNDSFWWINAPVLIILPEQLHHSQGCRQRSGSNSGRGDK